MPIIKPEEYRALKAARLISLERKPGGKVRVTINRGEADEPTKAELLEWITGERKALTEQLAVLDEIKADIDPL